MALKNKAADVAPEVDFDDLFVDGTELETLSSICIAIFGRAKVGKTHFAATALELGIPVIVIDTESSWRKNLKRFSPEMRSLVKVSEVMKFKQGSVKSFDLMQSLRIFRKSINAAVARVDKYREEGINHGVIVVDSATDLWDWLGIWIDEDASSSDMGRLRWGKPNSIYTEEIQKLIHSGWSVILVYRAKEAVSNQGQDLGYNKARWQKNTDYWIDLYGEISREGDNRYLSVDGDRFGECVQEIENPTFKKLLIELHNKAGIDYEFLNFE